LVDVAGSPTSVCLRLVSLHYVQYNIKLQNSIQDIKSSEEIKLPIAFVNLAANPANGLSAYHS